MAKGIYTEELAVKGMSRALCTALRSDYFKTHYGGDVSPDVPTRAYIAREVLDRYTDEIAEIARRIKNRVF